MIERASVIEAGADTGVPLVRYGGPSVELARGPYRRASECVGVGGKGERHHGELLDRHRGRHRERRQLGELDGPLTHDVAAEDGVALAVGDELAESRGAAVDDRAWHGVEALCPDDDVMGFAGGRLAEPDGGIFGVGEAAEWA